MTPRDVLDLPLGDNDAGAETVRDYLTSLLLTMWDQGESFSGKRPFGNSCWEYDLYKPLIRLGFVNGVLDADGCIEALPRHEQDKARRIIRDAIESLLE